MRGDVWTVAGAGYASKPRPAAIVQSDELSDSDSVVVCLFTTDDTKGGPTRVRIAANTANGLDMDFAVMVEKPVAIKRPRLGIALGRLSPDDMRSVDRALRYAFNLD